VDLVVVPSVWDEPFGLVAAESLARYTPLLVTDAGALPEIVGDEYPWIVPRNDASSITARILQMIDQPAETKSAIEKGYTRWLTRYSPQAGTARMRQLLAGLPQTR
jgi:glycosyltransferase involved in cell wall biosynthesis